MINKLKNEIKKEFEIHKIFPYSPKIENNLLELLILKYYCDNSILSYEEILKKEEFTDLKIPTKSIDFTISKVDNIKLLSLIQYKNLQTLIKEYINDKDIGINIINTDTKKICISKNLNNITNCLYDINGNTTYVFDDFEKQKYDIAIFQFFDIVLENNNKYILSKDLNLEDYQYIYLYDNTPKYKFIRNSETDIYVQINRLLIKNNNLKIILHTNYKKISNIKDSKYIMKYISKILLYDDINSFIYYEDNSTKNISIINYDRNKIKSLNKLLEIIENNRKQKDILVKTNADQIIENRYRIGFRLYQSEIQESIRNINEIVDQNTFLIEKLSSINTDIEQEINKLINK